MRRRKEIEGSIEEFDYTSEGLILEVLLDMRELLEDIKDGRRE